MPRPLDGDRPTLTAPPLTTDTHMHFFLPGYDGQPGGPPLPEMASIEDYAVVRRRLGIERVIAVQPNAYQADNSCLLHCLRQLGDIARGVAVVTPDTTEDELQSLHDAGIRGARIMNLPGGAIGLDRMQEVESLVRPLGWHLIVQFDGRNILEYLPLLRGLQGRFIVDHIGKFLEPVPTDAPSFLELKRLLDSDRCYLKLAGCYETSKTGAPKFDDVGRLAADLIAHAPERMIWGSNWPHIGVSADRYPDDAQLLDVLGDWTGNDPALLHRILVDTPAELYGF